MGSSPPLIFRPAIIGLALAIIIIFTFVALSGRTDIPFFSIEQAGEITEDQLPPVLFPMFPESGFSRTEEMGPPMPLVIITKTPEKRDVVAGSTATFTITVENVSSHALHDLTVEERYDSKRLSVIQSQALEGAIDENRIVWEIPLLDVEQTWTTQYEVELNEDVIGNLETTTYILGDELIDMPSNIRMSTSHLTSIALPAAGVELNWLWRLVGEIMN